MRADGYSYHLVLESGSMGEVDWSGDLRRRFKNLGVQVASVVVDGLFLALWAAVQYAVNRFIEWLELSSAIDQWVLFTLQVIFAVSTLAPVLIFLFKDIAIMAVRARDEVKEASQAGKTS